MTPHLQLIGDRIRAERLHQNLTQEHVFLAAGIDRRTLQSLEAGRGNPTIRAILRISHVLNVPLRDLLAERPPPP
ncbi:helix-turn-helix domain-containing protein [Streptomyces griseoluteus]|uniref:helix-turn-helix domain-containing protein n=1 Tax=Streptomyces griseoluteus TaxID=29306 RepID=UPI00366156BB